MTRALRVLCLAVATVLAVTTAGCAGVPSSSAPQALGTVERPAPPSLPTPTPGMEPDVLLREFLKATADPANRHLAARQFLTESASRAWDDAGSALLIDNVVFVETRGPEVCLKGQQAVGRIVVIGAAAREADHEHEE